MVPCWNKDVVLRRNYIGRAMKNSKYIPNLPRMTSMVQCRKKLPLVA